MCPVYAMPTRPSPRSERLGTPNTPAIRFTRGPFFEASLVRHCYGRAIQRKPWVARRMASRRFSARVSRTAGSGPGSARAKRRTVLRNAVSACGAQPERTRQASSRKLTSRRQCSWFSIAQCPRTSDSSASGPACSRVRLVTAYATSRLVWPLISLSRSMRPTWATPGQSRWGTTSRLVAMRRVSRRPCPFSTVQACSRSGGGPSQRASQGACSPRALISSGGKDVAECEGDVGHELRLVRLHGEQVVPLAVAHALANRPLAERGVSGDDGSRQRQALEQRQGSRNLVRLGRHLHLADHRPKLAGKGRHHVHTLAAVVPGRGTPAQALAVDRHGSERSGPLRPGAQHLV